MYSNDLIFRNKEKCKELFFINILNLNVMTTMKKLSILIIIFTALSCSNDNSSKEEETTATVKDIYVGGYEKKSNAGKLIATIWKNGFATSLTDGTKNAVVNDITVSGNDVYAVGFEEDLNGTRMVKFWKNSLPVNLVSAPGSFANAVAVNGKDVYILGSAYENNEYVQKMWKNGSVITLQGDRRSIAANNDNVYTVGVQEERARFWTNETGSNLANGPSYSGAYDIEIKGNDVYIAGVEVINKISVAKLWKNGIGSNLSDGKFTTVATDISITGNDVYVLGYENNLGSNSKLWKNGEVIWSKDNFETNDLKAVGQDYFLLSNAGQIAQIIENGVAQNLSSAFQSRANALFITTN